MSYRPYFRGGRPQIRRSYSDRQSHPDVDYREFVSGDSHFSAVRDANRGFRPSYHAVPPPPQYVTGQPPWPPVAQHLHRPRPYNHPRPVGPAYGNYQQFRRQQIPQQFRPSANKPPDYREWEYGKPGVPSHCDRFSVLSYNILADYLATDHWHKLYFHIPRYIMDWNWRKRSIVFELGLWSADILCFQEVDRFQDLEAELKPRGYNGIWKMRSGDRADGCAIFWRASRFKLLYEESIEYNKLGLRDNVAQICVFESLNRRNKSNGTSTLPTRSAISNRVVVCNIHVLFNTKRGDVKLGQMRVLLDRAHAVSKLWDDAPIVICGDFNCTPKSPMYNFITGYKLDLLELARDKVSGQTSAELRPPRPSYSEFTCDTKTGQPSSEKHPPRPSYPEFKTQAADNSTQTSAVDCENVEQGDLASDTQKFTSPHDPTNLPSAGSYPDAGCSILDETSDSCIDIGYGCRRDNDLPSHDAKGSSSDRAINEISVLQSSTEDIYSKPTEGSEYVEPNLQTVAETTDDLTDTSKSKAMYAETSQVEGPPEKSFPNSCSISSSEQAAVAFSVSAAYGNNASASCEATCVDVTLDEKFEALSLDEVIDGAATDETTEDNESFFSELLGAGQNPFPTDTDSGSPNQQLHSHGDEILNENLENESIHYIGNLSYQPTWTPAEIETATGSADCKVMEHPLKLTSAYAEVENNSGLRDSSGEPFVTSYHRRFSGTVDYIWHSEGLQTAKVLAPIPKHIMQQTRGFPTRKWGSDHIALVSEFAFTKDISPENFNQ